MIEIRVRADDLSALARDLRRASDGKDLSARLRRELRQQANQLVPPLRQSIMAIPSKDRPRFKGRAPLRALMARSVTVQVRTGKVAAVRVFMNPKRMPDGMKSLPAYFEGTPGHMVLRHPVFGNRNAWAAQLPRPYFAQGTRDAEQLAADGVKRVVDDIAREIEQ